MRDLPEPPVARPLVFAGPGVLAAGAVDALRRFASHSNVGVANSYGAKGVFRWDDPHHYGTVGLQRDDFALAGFAAAPAIVAVGVDEVETPGPRWRLAPVVELDPAQLDDAASRWPMWEGALEPPPLYRALADVVQPLYGSDAQPMPPPRVIASIAAALRPGDRVLAMPGRAGFWVGRAFATTEPGSIVVSCAIAGAAPAATRVAVTDGDPDAVPGDVVVEVWGAAGDLQSASEHDEALADALRRGRRAVLHVQVDLDATDLLVAVAGPIVAWE